VLLISLYREADGMNPLVGVRYLLGDLDARGPGWSFKTTSGGVLDDGRAFYAPQVLAEPDRTLLVGWACELDRSDAQIVEAGWAGVLTFPRELYVRNRVLGTRPATELTRLRRAPLVLRADTPFRAPAFELVASGPVALRLVDDGVDAPAAAAEGTPSDPVRILVDGSMVEVFHRGVSHTTRAYPGHGSRWVVEGTAVTGYRLGRMVRDSPFAADVPPNLEVSASS
jgi:beta-fructofuranosidase